MAYEIDKRLMELNVRDLPLNRRQQLSSYLNVEQILMSDCGFARDYRGIAQQLNLSYSEIAQLEKLFDPCGTLLNYQQCSKLTVFNLFELLLTIGRYDILDDMIPIILDDIENNQNIHDNDDNEQCSSLALKPIIPIENESRILYDAYVCYADSDINFVRNLAEHLESPSVGFRLFIRDRDLLVGNWVYETFARLIETQCRRMIIILSPEFLQSHDCKFQSMFAAGLAIEKCQRILIPVIYKQCETIPSLLRLLSKIDMSNHRLTNNNQNDNGCDTIPEWSMKRLIMSIKPEKQYQQYNRLIEIRNKEPLIEYNDDDNDNHTNPNNNNQRLKMIENTKTQISVISNNDNIVDNDDDQQLLSTTHLISTDNQPKNLQNSTKIPTNNTNNRSKNWLKSIKKKIKVVL